MSMSFLSHIDIREEVRNLLYQSNQFIFAVAVWGDRAGEQLGLTSLKPGQTGKIICNLKSGACNPAEIRKLANIAGIEVLQKDDLHAKIYWGEGGVIIGSSNASTNGLTFEGAELTGWIEGNVSIADTEFRRVVHDWLEKSILKHARPIDDRDLKLAEIAWNKRRQQRHAQKQERGSIVEVLENNAEYFRDKPIVVWIFEDLSTSPAADRVGKRAQKELRNSKITWYEDAKERPGATILDFTYVGDYFEGTKISFGGMCRVLSDNPVRRCPGSGSILLCNNVREFEGLTLSDSKATALSRLISKWLKGRKPSDDGFAFPLAELGGNV